VAVVAYAFEDLLDILHKSVVEDRFAELDVSEVALALSSLSAGFALLVHGAHTESQIVRAWVREIKYFQEQGAHPHTAVTP
jgi:hypothetical protein